MLTADETPLARPDGPTVVALSGGVDSATAAALLVERGERVIGVSMRLYSATGTSASIGGRCCGPRDLEDARRVAAHLGIPFYVADYEEEFLRAVVDDFVSEYAAGRTPNPCVRCNQHIKFTPLLRRARALGASSLVTGHYARLRRGEAGRVELWRAVDRTKDQSYFLFHMPPAALDFVRFPLGELDKGAVRSEARRLGLPVADKAESQEICFVPDGDHAAFVAAARPEVEAGGELVDTAGNVIGRHGGIHQFTIGQRRGIRVASLERRYVVDVDAQTARVVVGTAEELSTSTIWVEELTWLGAPAPSEPFRAEVQIRYRHAPEPAWVTPAGPGAVRVDFDRPERGPAAGQAAVLYLGERVLGGGFLTRSAPTGGTT